MRLISYNKMIVDTKKDLYQCDVKVGGCLFKHKKASSICTDEALLIVVHEKWLTTQFINLESSILTRNEIAAVFNHSFHHNVFKAFDN